MELIRLTSLARRARLWGYSADTDALVLSPNIAEEQSQCFSNLHFPNQVSPFKTEILYQNWWQFYDSGRRPD